MSSSPLISFVLLAYRQEQVVREAVRSALAQSYENLEIVLSDDASPDNTYEVMAEEVRQYCGPHKVLLNRNPSNLGMAGNFNRALQLSSGELLVLQGGDDISLPRRTTRLVEGWMGKSPRPDLVYSAVTRIDEKGQVLKQQEAPLPIISVEELIRGKWFIAGGCANAYSRMLFEKYGPLNTNVQFEDYVLTFRALLGNGCTYIDEPLVYYRVHQQSVLQTIERNRGTRSAEKKRTIHIVAEEEERLKAWDLSGREDKYLRWRLVRNLDHARLDAKSCASSRFGAMGCVLKAIFSARPRAAWKFFHRDVLLLE